MQKRRGICNCCFGHFDNANIMYASEIPQVGCNKSWQEACECMRATCKFHFDEDDCYACDEFIFCDECFADYDKVIETLENYIKTFSKEECRYPKIKHEKYKKYNWKSDYKEYAKTRDAHVYELWKNGKTLSWLAKYIDRSKERVRQIINKAEKKIEKMKISIGAHTILHPMPVLIVGTYSEEEKPNIMTAAWGGICCSVPPCIAISLRKATLTYHNIKFTKAFTINIPSEKYIKEADFVGLVSGRDTDKFKTCKFTPIKSDKVNAPLVKELPYSLECKLINVIELGLHTQFIGEIVDIKADESVLDKNKFPDIEKLKPVVYSKGCSNNYYGIGAKLAKAFSVGKEIN